MKNKNKRSFFEKLTGTIDIDNNDMSEFEVEETAEKPQSLTKNIHTTKKHIHNQSMQKTIKQEPIQQVRPEPIKQPKPAEEENTEGELAVDVYQTPTDIVIQAMIAGVRPDDVSISITRDIIIIKGERMAPKNIPQDSYFHNELYWGAFSRKINLPEEIDPDEAEAFEKHGLLMLRLPKIVVEKTKKLRVQST